MVDIHAHLLNKDVKFDRFYDKIAIKFFASKLGIEPQKLIDDPYSAYTNGLIKNIKESKHLKRSVLFGVDSGVDLKGKIVHNDLIMIAC
jgi:hypothetical protein